MKQRIAIIGGSISGCMLAQLLKKNPNIEVLVFERSSSSLSSRGTGITLPISLITEINQLVSIPCSFYPIKERVFYTKTLNGEAQEIWRQDIALAIVNWGLLYKSLRTGLDDIYHEGCAVKNIEHAEGMLPIIELETGEKKQFDVVVCADGYQSFGRTLLFPDFELSYAGYIAWRGTTKVADNSSFDYYCFSEGHAIAIPVPSNSSDTGAMRSWILYAKIEPTKLAIFMHTQKPSQPLTKSSKATLHYLTERHLPSHASNMIANSDNPFYQVIYDGKAPSVSKDNVILLGDAAKVLRPHLGSGGTEGMRQAFALADQIKHSANLADAIANWTKSENIKSEEMSNLAQHMGNALVTTPPDWSKMDPDLMEKWWNTMMSGRTWYIVDDAKQMIKPRL